MLKSLLAYLFGDIHECQDGADECFEISGFCHSALGTVPDFFTISYLERDPISGSV